jgi:hypothetical protein
MIEKIQEHAKYRKPEDSKTHETLLGDCLERSKMKTIGGFVMEHPSLTNQVAHIVKKMDSFISILHITVIN